MAEFDVGLEAARIADASARTVVEADERFARSGLVVGKAESHGVAVSVAPGGLLTGLTISRGALRCGSDAVAGLIMELFHRATRRVGDRMHELLSPVLDEDQLTSLGHERLAEDDPDAQHS